MDKHPSVKYAEECVKRGSIAPKYVKKQCKAFLKIVNDQDPEYIVDWNIVKKIDVILKLAVMPKGLRAGDSLYECSEGYQWLIYVASLAVVRRDNSKKRRFETILLEIARKNFKALSLDTPIPTPTGWKEMKNIHPGDYVFGREGNPTLVLGESEIFHKPMYLVTFEDGAQIKASADHIWTVKTKGGKATASRGTRHIGTGKRYRDGGWFETTTEAMSVDFAKARRDRKGTEYKYRVPVNGAVQYPEKKLQIAPYLLGAWLGDGTSIYTNITVSDEDAEEMMQNVVDASGYAVELHRCKDRSSYFKVDKQEACRPAQKGSFLYNLRALDLIKNKHIPIEYLTASVEQRFELLQGLMDTDGSCSKAGQCSFVQKSKALADGVLELINSLGFKAKMIKRKSALNGKEISDIYHITFFADKSTRVFKLERKYARQKDHLSERMKAKSIINIEKINAEPSKCIMVADKEHLYLAGKHFTPTHNTFTVATVFILLFILEPPLSKFYSVAPDGSLSREVKEAISDTLRMSPALYEYAGEARFKILRDYIEFKPTHSKYIPLNYSTSRMDGKLPNVYLADEVGALPNSYPIEAMKSGQLNILNKLGFIISTKYPTIDNPFEDEVKYAKKVLDGIIKDESVFALLYEPDNTKNWMTDDKIMLQANPVAVDSPEIWEDLKKKRARAIEMESARENFLTKHCNIIYSGAGTETYIPVEAVRKCRVDHIDWTGREVYLGVDLSMTNDNTSVAMVAEEDGKIIADSFAFIPEGRIDEKNKIEKIDYRKYINAGKCFACGDLTIDYGFVEEFVFKLEEQTGARIMAIGFDRYNALSSAQKWDKVYNTVEVKQHSSVLHPPTKLLYEKIVNGEFEYEKNDLLEINFQNAKCTFDTTLNRYVNKKKSAGKVDMVVSMINAVYLLQQDKFLNGMDFVVQTV